MYIIYVAARTTVRDVCDRIRACTNDIYNIHRYETDVYSSGRNDKRQLTRSARALCAAIAADLLLRSVARVSCKKKEGEEEERRKASFIHL